MMFDRMLKSSYVGGTRAVRSGLRTVGALDRLDAAEGRRAKWIRSLLAIYDLDDMERIGLPWWTFDAIEAVQRFLGQSRDKRVFEWGSGASTLWLSERAKSVTSIEFDPEWHAALSKKLTNRPVSLKLVPSSSEGSIGSAKSGFEGRYFDAFVAAIQAESDPFDLIVIDGRAREACLAEAIPHLAPGGIIVFDDTKRERYQRAIAATPLKLRRFDGLAVSLPFPDSTTLLAEERSTLDAL